MNKDKLKPIPSGDKNFQDILQTDFFIQAAQQPLPFNQADDEFFAQQRPTSGSACDITDQRVLCEQILKSDPLRGIEDNQMYFTKLNNEFCDRIRELDLLDKTQTEFSAINNDYERIQYILQFEEIRKMKITIYNSKSEIYAKALEEEYNNCCHESDKGILNRGLKLINKSIQFTSGTNRKLLGIRLMKRAWINLMMTRFDEAREDAHRSLEHHHDPSDMWNSLEILGHCYAKRTDNSTAEHFFKEALDGLRQCDICNEAKAASAKRISNVYKYVKGRKDVGGSDKNCTEDLMTPQISYGINRILKCATDAVEIKVKEETGRGLYARREIKPGDVIIVENPFVSALNKERFETHCNNCYKRFRSSIPCDTCSRVWFCSEECLKESKAGFHSSECHVLNLLYEEGIGSMGIVAFRILLRLTWENIKSLRKSRKINTRFPDSHPLHKEFNWKEKYFTDDYLTSYKLVTNSEKRSFGDLFKRTITAVYIKECLKVVDFFKVDNISLDDEIFVASLILRHLQNSSCNAYGITEFIVQESYMDNVDILELGGGIYPTISLINHSCNPNVFRYSTGKHCIVRATKIIKKGEQLFDNYGSLFDTLGRERRREVLTKQYKFDCECIACKGNWPLYKENKAYMKFACPEENCDHIVEYDGGKKMNCPSCGFNRKHENLMSEAKGRIKEFKEGLDSLKRGFKDKATVTIKHFQIYADKNVIAPSRCLTECQEIFKRCFLIQGNLFESKETEG